MLFGKALCRCVALWSIWVMPLRGCVAAALGDLGCQRDASESFDQRGVSEMPARVFDQPPQKVSEVPAKVRRRRRLRKELAQGLRQAMPRDQIVRLVSQHASVKRSQQKAENATCPKRRKVIAALWNDGVAANKREELQDDLNFVTSKGKQGAERDGRCLSTQVAQRIVFKDTNSGGHMRPLNLFHTSGGDTCVAATVMAADTILKEQRSAVGARLKAAGGTGVAILHWQFDGTPQLVKFQDCETEKILDQDLEAHLNNKPCTRDVLVQKGFFITDEGVEDIFVKPLVLGDQSSLTHLNAIMLEMADCGLDLMDLASAYSTVLIHFGADGAATCDLVIDYIKSAVAGVENIIFMNSTTCLLHGLNRVCADYVTFSGFDLGGCISITNLLYIGSYFSSFRKAAMNIALQDVHWDQSGGVSDGEAEANLRLVHMCLPGLHSQTRKLAQVLEALRVLNGKWYLSRVSHSCELHNGVPCCSSLQEVKLKIRHALNTLLLLAMPPVPCTIRWLSTYQNLGWWALGIFCHGLFPRAFVMAFPARDENPAPVLLAGVDAGAGTPPGSRAQAPVVKNPSKIKVDGRTLLPQGLNMKGPQFPLVKVPPQVPGNFPAKGPPR